MICQVFELTIITKLVTIITRSRTSNTHWPLPREEIRNLIFIFPHFCWRFGHSVSTLVRITSTVGINRIVVPRKSIISPVLSCGSTSSNITVTANIRQFSTSQIIYRKMVTKLNQAERGELLSPLFEKGKLLHTLEMLQNQLIN